MIIASNDNRTIAQIFGVAGIQHILNANPAIFDDLPFVEIGNVFASLTITGPDSWPTIMRHYNNDNFVLLGGRHGNYINPIGGNLCLDPGDLATNVNDPSHISKDLPNTLPFRNRLEIIDVSRRQDLQSSAGLMKFCHDKSQENKKVILAWCYGIFTHVESQVVSLGEDVSNPNSLSYPQWNRLARMTISDIVERHW